MIETWSLPHPNRNSEASAAAATAAAVVVVVATAHTAKYIDWWIRVERRNTVSSYFVVIAPDSLGNRTNQRRTHFNKTFYRALL